MTFENVTVDAPVPAPGALLLAGIPGSGKSTVSAALLVGGVALTSLAPKAPKAPKALETPEIPETPEGVADTADVTDVTAPEDGTAPLVPTARRT